MATTLATTSAQILSQLIAAGTNDTIEVAPGNYTRVTRTSGSLVKSGVTIRAQDPDNQPVFLNAGFSLKGVSGVTFKQLTFRGTTTDGTPSIYPTADFAFYIENFDKITVEDCTMDFYKIMCYFGPGTDFIFRFNRQSRWGIDANRIYTAVTLNDYTYNEIVNNWAGPAMIDEPRIDNPSTRHPDWLQFVRRAGNPPASDFYIGRNYLDLGNADQDRGLTACLLSSGDTGAFPRSLRLTIEDNYSRGGRRDGWALDMSQDAIINRNVLRETASIQHVPRIRLIRATQNVTVTNNVMAAALEKFQWSQVGTETISNNIVSTTAIPAGFYNPQPGVNTGPRTSGVTLPAQPTVAGAAGDGYFGAAYEVAVGVYAGVLIIPTGSVASGITDPARFNWRNTGLGITDPQPLRVASPPSSAAGRRFETLAPDVALATWTAGYSEPFTGSTWRYANADGVWSDWSSYVSGWTAPAEPVDPDPELPGLTAGQWEVPTTAVLVQEDRYTFTVRTTGTTPTHTGMEYDLAADGVWRALTFLDDDGGDLIYQAEPSAPGGLEHTVGFAEVSPNIRVRYFVNTTPSLPSVDAKTFTGPTAPATQLAPGDRYGTGSALRTLGGFRLLEAAAVRPAVPSGVEASTNAGTITVLGPDTPPAGAAWVQVRYAGRAYEMTDGSVSFPEVSGQTLVLVRGIAADGTPGISNPVFV